ncbi:hypothetical protein [Aliivibrio fischeri]|uniref:3-dehydroquinate synthase family protein n=1 Tax=Aliivibrio fischeri TaxID=668 RepID=UPI001F18DF84|nr:hypothetical protein [Aliivibrio fischeri]MCE7534926.1 hypothetical protein [Aliivibrio fischeri]MCE7559368.1 hypothetical protein [Aliivibrio fischeri]
MIDNNWTSNSVVTKDKEYLHVESELKRDYYIINDNTIFEKNNKKIEQSLAGKDCIVVYTNSIKQNYSDLIYEKFNSLDSKVSYLNITVTEDSKDIKKVMEVIDFAKKVKLPRDGIMISISGGVCSDIVGTASSIYKRGVGCIKIPTTLIGMVDAAIGVKNGLNIGSSKSAIGSFYPVQKTIISPFFLNTLPEKNISDGFAEIIKMAVIKDKDLFYLLEKPKLTDEDIGLIIKESICRMLEELSENLYELDSLKRTVDFGHTFSPYIESMSDYKISHGQAVAVDIALSSALSYKMGLLNKGNLQRILNVLTKFNLPITYDSINYEDLLESLNSVCLHRAGKLNLVIPLSIGKVTYIESIDEKFESYLSQSLKDINGEK